uniref:UDP-N-acetylglucosamine--dolichyl-phosphate N-acetylglucosaminephosphotransferase n=1 Tax=Ignisphaera aggregans TaxID=334771 RepID=A0A7C2ZNI8_9CREN
MALPIIFALTTSMVVTYLISMVLIYVEKRVGVLCKDAHKPYEYSIPCIGGFPLYAGLVPGLFILYMHGLVELPLFTAFLAVISLGLIIGFIDDTVGLGSKWKIILGFLPAIPIILTECFVPRPWLPFIGHARLFVLYPLLVVLASTVYTNGANMVDTHNGVLPMFAISFIFGALLLKIVSVGMSKEVLLALLIIASLLSYLRFNIYPARMFNGNTGAFLIGSMLMFVLVALRVEFYAILASIPMFLNGFYYISSVRGFLQKEQVKRPTYLDSNGCIYPSKHIHPITFIKLLLVLGGKPLSEKELVEVVYSIYIASALLGFTVCYLLGYSC